MTRTRLTATLIIAMTLALTGGLSLWLASGDAVAAPTPPGPQPNGVNFTIKLFVDQNFCVVDRPPPSHPASEASMAQCAPVDTQHWTFAKSANGTVVLIGGTQGECLDFTAAVPSPVSVTPCTFQGPEHFFYTPSGQIELPSGTKCLQAAAAALDATLSIVKCKAGIKLQVWVIGH